MYAYLATDQNDCSYKSYTPAIKNKEGKLENIAYSEWDGNYNYWTFRGGYGNEITSPRGNYSGIMKFENLQAPWQWGSSAGEMAYPGVGMVTMLTSEDMAPIGKAFEKVTAIKFWMKASSNVKKVIFKVETSDQKPITGNGWASWSDNPPDQKKNCMADASYRVEIDGTGGDLTDWKQYSVRIADGTPTTGAGDLKYPTWEPYKKYNFVKTNITRLGWTVEGVDNVSPADGGITGWIAVDDIEIVDYTEQ